MQDASYEKLLNTFTVLEKVHILKVEVCEMHFNLKLHYLISFLTVTFQYKSRLEKKTMMVELKNCQVFRL